MTLVLPGFRPGAWNGLWVRFERRTGILLGPETTSAVNAGLVQTRSGSVAKPVGVAGEVVADKEVRVWCWLRIAQWMRASL